MRFLATLAFVLLVLSVEAAAGRVFGWSLVHVDVSIAVVVFVAIHAPLVEGAFTALAVGYMLDALAGRPTGLYAALAVLVYVGLRIANMLVDTRTRAGYAAAAAAASLVHGVLAAGLTWLTSRGGQGAGLSGLPMQVVLTALAAFALFPLLKKINPGVERPEPGVLR